jgi:pimeloyl-ACP methyl ester carboxylesterase
MIDRDEFLDLLAERRTDEIVVYTMSPYTYWGSVSPSPLNFFVAGAMGFASSVGLGAALAQPDRRVWVIDGDGSLLMNLGTLATIAQQAPANLVHIVMNNGVYELVGHVPTPVNDNLSLTGLASAAGIQTVHELSTLDEAKQQLPAILDEQGPVFLNVKVSFAKPTARRPSGTCGRRSAFEHRGRGDRVDEHDEGDEFATYDAICAEVGVERPPLTTARRSFDLPDGRELSAVVWGDEPPQVVFLHGGAQNARTWDATALALGRPAVAFDLAGHGHSSWREDATYHPRTLADDVAVVMPELTDEPVVLVGMSLGGLTAIALGAWHASLWREIVVVDVTPGVGTKPSPNQKFVQGPESYASLEEMLERAVAYYPGRSREGLRRGIINNARQREDGRWIWRHHFGNLPEPPSRDHSDLWPAVDLLTMPVTLVLGGESWVVDEGDLAEFRRRCPQVAVEVVPGAGHTVQGSHPRELAALLCRLPSLA